MLVRDGENRDSAWYSIVDDEWPGPQRAPRPAAAGLRRAAPLGRSGAAGGTKARPAIVTLCEARYPSELEHDRT